MQPRRHARLAFLLLAGPLSASLFLLWFVSYCFCIQLPVRFGAHLYSFDFSVGCIWIYDFAIWNPATPLTDSRAHFTTFAFGDDAGWRALPSFEYTGPTTTPPPNGSQLNIRWILTLPLYPFFLSLGIPVLLMLRNDWRQRRRGRIGKCKKCGYDTSGITGLCPECGSTISTN